MTLKRRRLKKEICPVQKQVSESLPHMRESILVYNSIFLKQ